MGDLHVSIYLSVDCRSLITSLEDTNGLSCGGGKPGQFSTTRLELVENYLVIQVENTVTEKVTAN